LVRVSLKPGKNVIDIQGIVKRPSDIVQSYILYSQLLVVRAQVNVTTQTERPSVDVIEVPYRAICFRKIHLHVTCFGLRRSCLRAAQARYQQQSRNNSILAIHAGILKLIPAVQSG
jgi:hypothetical protein